MPYALDQKLVIAVSSSAVFDMREADSVFRTEGEESYRKYQLEFVGKPFERGVAFPFIKRLLALNELYPDEPPIEVIVLSRNDPESGLRFFRSCQYYKLEISRGAFTTGKEPYEYAPAFNAALFLSANKEDVDKAIAAGHPAGLVLGSTIDDQDEDKELRIAFDFDCVLADDESEKVFRESGLDVYQAAEWEKASVPLSAGPLKDLIGKLSYIQQLEKARVGSNRELKIAIRVAIVTARNAPAHERMIKTLSSWGLPAVELFLLGGVDKKRILDVLRPHIFFDDQMQHLEPSAASVPSVHIPFGPANLKNAVE